MVGTERKPDSRPGAPSADGVERLTRPVPAEQPADGGVYGGDSDDGMVAMARANERAHLAPAPGAKPPPSPPFPPALLWGLVFGALGGALVGLVVGALLLNRTLVVPGWEQLYSMTPGTFFTFWVGIGLAVGLLLGGVGTLLAVSPPADSEPGPRPDPDGRRSRLVAPAPPTATLVRSRRGREPKRP